MALRDSVSVYFANVSQQLQINDYFGMLSTHYSLIQTEHQYKIRGSLRVSVLYGRSSNGTVANKTRCTVIMLQGNNLAYWEICKCPHLMKYLSGKYEATALPLYHTKNILDQICLMVCREQNQTAYFILKIVFQPPCVLCMKKKWWML